MQARPFCGSFHQSAASTSRTVSRTIFTPHTGRTHQLRLAATDPHRFGIPIIGDSLYSLCASGERLMFHAKYLRFTHPVTRTQMDFTLPEAF